MDLSPLQAIVEDEIDAPASGAVQAVAEAARARHPGTLAILFYGSCLRSGSDEGGLVDLYLVVEGYRQAHRNPLSALGNRVLPPNVYYQEVTFEGRTVRAKYALVTLDALEWLVTQRSFHPYFWARFAQPTGLLWSSGPTVRQRVVALLAQAVATLGAQTRPLLPERTTPAALFERAFAETYRTELRAEQPGRAAELVARYAERYEGLGTALLPQLPAPSSQAERRARRRWALRRAWGKLLSVARLTKAAFTFAGGQSYLLWKIERHSGVRVVPKPWEQRHPLLSAPFLAWRLYRRGGFR